MAKQSLEPGATAVREIVKIIPLAARLMLSEHIITLSRIHKIEDNLLADRRQLKPKLSDDELRTRRIERYRKKVSDPNYDRSYIVESSNLEMPYQCGLKEAAEMAKIQPNSLRRHVSLKGKYSTSVQNEHEHMEQLVIYRCNPDGSPRHTNVVKPSSSTGRQY